MNTEYDEKILRHYNEVAKTCGTLPASTMADEFVRRRETETILNFVRAVARRATPAVRNTGLTIVDIGCGNGYTLRQLSEAIPGHGYIGIEFNAALRTLAIEQNAKHARVIAGDIRDLSTIGVERNSVDILICQRVLINLMVEKDQKKALDNVLSLVRPGGALLFIEAFREGLQNLNDARAEFGLAPIEPAIHNLYLNGDFFLHRDLKPADFLDWNIETNFFSTHYYISRVLHEVFNVAAGVTERRRNSHFVRFWSAALPAAIGDYSPLRIYSFVKVAR
jgi:SAM-dependent methyltransferase